MVHTRLGLHPIRFSRESGRILFEKRTVRAVPDEPGIFIFLDSRNEIIYIDACSGLGRVIQQQFNSHRWPEVTHFKWAATPEAGHARLLAERLIAEFDPPFNRRVQETRRYASLIA